MDRIVSCRVVKPNDNTNVNVATVNINPNVNVAMPVNVNPSVVIALSNPLILERIFGYLTVDKVKDARTVCKIWESVGTTCVGRRCSFSINKFFEEYGIIGFRLSPTIKPQLLRTVKIGCVYLMESNLRHGRMSNYDFLVFVMKYQEHIKEIQFNVGRQFGPTMKYVLENVNFSKLETIDLYENYDWTESVEGFGWDSFNYLNFLPLPMLTTFKISSPEDMWGRDGDNRVDEKDGFPYYQIVQEIINKSPNLEKLEIRENFYPDLSCCRKLKVLKCEGHLFKPLRIPEDGEDSDSWVDSSDDDHRSFIDGLKQLKSVKFTSSQAHIRDYGCDNFEKPFLSVRNIKLSSKQAPSSKWSSLFSSMISTFISTTPIKN